MAAEIYQAAAVAVGVQHLRGARGEIELVRPGRVDADHLADLSGFDAFLDRVAVGAVAQLQVGPRLDARCLHRLLYLRQLRHARD